MQGTEKVNLHLIAAQLNNLSLSALPQLPQDQLDSLASITIPKERHAHKQRGLLLRYLLFFTDLVLACFPLLFLGLAIAAIVFNGKSWNKLDLLSTSDPSTGQDVRHQIAGTQAHSVNVVDGGDTIIEAAKIAVSIFPIIFAAIVGRFLKHCAVRRAEDGAPLRALEQLYGSQNFSSAVQLTYRLGAPGMLGVGMIVLWLLSPLGGQATQRVLTKTTVFNHSTGNVFYTNTSATNGAFADRFASAGLVDNIYATLSAAMLSDTVTTDNDVWGNVRIPNFEKLDTKGYDLDAVANGSCTVHVPARSLSSSMVGLLINNISDTAITNFTVETSYVNLTCEEPLTWNYSATADGVGIATQPIQQQLQPYYDFLTWANLVTKLTNSTNTDSKSTTSGTYVDPFWTKWNFNIGVQTNGTSNTTGHPVPTFANPPTFIYAAQDNYNNVITAYKCVSKVILVESDVICDRKALCRIYGMRNSMRTQEAGFDPLFDQSNDENYHDFPLNLMLNYLNAYSTSSEQDVVNPIQWYLAGSSNVFPPRGGTPDYTQVSGDQMATKLGTLLNTFWMIGLQRASISQPRSTNATLLLASEYNSTTYGTYPSLDYDVTGALARFSRPLDIYAVNWPFVIIAIVISLMLFFLGLLSIYYRGTNSHPDILGYVSTLTRDNPNFMAPLDAHQSDGLELASYYKSLRVQLVSTVSDDDRGRLTLRPLYGGV